MPRGQFYSVFTLGFATAIGFLGVVAGVALLFWHEPYWRVAGALDGQVNWLSPLYFSLIVAGAAVFVAYWMVRIQQAIVRWSGNRLIAKLDAERRAIALAHGSEYADEFIKQKALAMLGDQSRHFNVFGRDEMLHAMAAAGVRIPIGK
jgi:hypothetical protein